jgi:hypothetical protein
MDEVCCPADDPRTRENGVNPVEMASLKFDSRAHVALFQELLSMPRETVPQLTAAAARKALAGAAAILDLEFIVVESIAPTFLLLPRKGSEAALAVFGSWHAEAHPVFPAAVEGAERLALSAAIGALAALRAAGVDSTAVVVAPAAAQGSVPLLECLRARRGQLQSAVAFWPRVSPAAPKRRRVFLGARGRVVLAVRDEGLNAYTLRDQLVARLKEEAYGPRPLDFELLRKLADQAQALDFLEETLDDPKSVAGEGEARLRAALFEPRGQVIRPAVRHPDRPQAWIVVETTENMDAADVARSAGALAGGGKIEMVEEFPWDRMNIHHPAIQAEIRTAKSHSDGAEIWPMAPWVTPSGLFSKALGMPLAEWSVPLPQGAAIRFPSAEALETMERELAELFLRSLGALSAPSHEA